MKLLFKCRVTLATTFLTLTIHAAGHCQVAADTPAIVSPQSSSLYEDEFSRMRHRMEQYEVEMQHLRQQVGQTSDLEVLPANWSEAANSGVGDCITCEEQHNFITKPTHKLRGRLFFDHTMYTDDPALGLNRQNETGFDTARIGMQGHIFENVKYQIEVEFEGEETDFKTVYIEITDLPLIGHFRAGHFYEAIAGLDEESGSRYQMFMERALATSAFIPSRSFGYMAYDYWENSDIHWALGTFRHESDDGPAKRALIRGDQGDWVFTSRLATTPHYQKEGRYLLHLGMGYTYRTDAEQVFFRTVTELGNNLGFLATTVPDRRKYSLLSPEFLLIWGPASVQSEWYFATTGSTNFWGGYVEASYFLTGDHRGYDLRKKELTRPVIRRNFLTGCCHGMGAWEVKARWSHVDLSEGVDPAAAVSLRSRGRQNNFLAGFNWYLNSYTRVMFDYLYEDVDMLTGVKGHTHTFGTRLQVHW